MQSALNALLIKEKNDASPLNTHPQIPLISDTLLRLNQHHVLLKGPTSKILRRAFSESIAALNPSMDFIYWDLDLNALHQDLETWLPTLQKLTVFILDGKASAQHLSLFKQCYLHRYMRFIFFDTTIQAYCDNEVSEISWEIISEDDLVSLFSLYKHNLENHHGTPLSDEIFSYAYSLAKHYLDTRSTFDTTIQLIDSACSRARRTDCKVSTDTIAEVVASMTQISVNHLHHNKLKTTQLIPALQQHIFGQETAINLIGITLQSIPLQPSARTMPLGCFLFVGKQGVGKRKLAMELTRYLFGSDEAVLQVIPHENPTSWLALNVAENSTSTSSLVSAIQKKPYAIILFENINEIFKNSTAFLEEMLSSPLLRHAIIIITTTLGSEKLTGKETNISQQHSPVMDLMQLVLNENPLFNNPREASFNIHDKILLDLKTFFTTNVLQQLQIVPFMPLEGSTIEKIMRLKLQQLSQTLETRFHIELQYAPEVIRFLLHSMHTHTISSQTIDKTLEQAVYSCISHAIFSSIEGSTHKRRLFLSLNDSGQLLKSEFITTKINKEYYTC